MRPPGQSSVDKERDYLTRDEVLEILGIKPQTLYAYVSRGIIRALPRPGRRSNLYLGDDVERIRSRGAARAGLGAIAASAMQWGEPIIATNITQITEAGPRYRNRLAVDLARSNASFETVAEFLWEGTWVEQAHGWAAPRTPAAVISQLAKGANSSRNPHVMQLMILGVGLLGVSHGSRRERAVSGIAQALLIRQAIRVIAGVLGFLGPQRRFLELRPQETIASGVARAFGLEPSIDVLRAINAMLVLDLDHELTSSTFSARIAASVGADLHACLGAALNTHYTEITGARADKVEELFGLRRDQGAILRRVEGMLASAQRVPGFDHPFYPNGDPRAAILLALARGLGKGKRSVVAMLGTVDQLQEKLGLRPSFDLGAVAVCRALGLPPQTASGLRSLARTAGWAAHVAEQRLSASMLRPRARYVGPSVRTDDRVPD